MLLKQLRQRQIPIVQPVGHPTAVLPRITPLRAIPIAFNLKLSTSDLRSKNGSVFQEKEDGISVVIGSNSSLYSETTK